MKEQACRVFAIAAGFGLTLVLSVSVASAFVLANKSAPQKLRKDVDKQSTKHTSCVIKALLKCEARGGHSGVECHTDTGVVDYAGDPSLDPKNKQPGSFNSALSKCGAKFDPSKKGSDYTGIGCPGDCDLAADGVQRCADMAAYEALIEGPLGGTVKAQLPVFGVAIDAFCATDTGDAANSTNQVQIDCTANNSDTLARYFKGLGKCYGKCENDYKGKSGGGGDDDDPNCIVDDAGADPAFQACADSALAKAEKKNPLTPTNKALGLPTANTVFNDASNGLYNRFDLVDPGVNPCSTCGNGTREGVEECDGADASLCVGGCNSDCTCSPLPAEWTCDPTFYGTEDGCDCGCGAVDADCVDATVESCEFNDCVGGVIDPADSTKCAWTCNPFFYEDGSCNCGCGAVDPDCADATVASCDFCGNDVLHESCQIANDCSDLVPINNAVCRSADWVCNPTFYGNADGCDCGCGAVDPDCVDATVGSCEFTDCPGGLIDPADSTECAWMCQPSFYGGADGCDCGCGAVDADCADAAGTSCDFCEPNLVGSCAANSAGCDAIDPTDNATCVIPEWTCVPSFYGGADGCDCGCGIVDPDCVDATVGSCEFTECVDGLIDAADSTKCAWTCVPLFYSAADGCDCGCGVVDPDCIDATVGSCDFCGFDACCFDGGIGVVDPVNNAVCGP